MKYGLIGERLGHSYSKEIHRVIADYDYELCEIPPDGVRDFILAREFSAINVTIPYKETVMPLLDEISDEARAIGAVNTVVNREGRLYGYNTDFAGMRAMLGAYGITLQGKKVLILGTGGTSKTATAVARAEGAREVFIVSRRGGEGKLTYGEALSAHTDAEIILNTTPVGMFPHTEETPIDLARFPLLSGVCDAVYNPLRTALVVEAAARGIPACGGLYMLAAQAVYASALFLGKEPDEALIEKAFSAVRREKESIVLIGMPSSGKSTVGRRLAALTGREFYDSDDLLLPRLGMSISDFFAAHGEAAFRAAEREVIAALADKSGAVIATGGGVPLFPENMARLRRNGTVIFLDRSPEHLLATPDRPLSCDPEALMRRYRERYGIYTREADIRVDGDGDAELVAKAALDAGMRLLS